MNRCCRWYRDGTDAVLLPSGGTGFAWQFSVLSRLSSRAGRSPVFGRHIRGPMQAAAMLDEVCERHLVTLRREPQPRGPYYLLGYSLGGTLARVCSVWSQGEEVAFLGLLDTWPPETQNWAEKRLTVLIRLLAEINRERESLPCRGASKRTVSAMRRRLCRDTIRLLTTAHGASLTVRRRCLSPRARVRKV
ncbi:thioesterase domain-containing protein [Shigella flexneri]